MVQCRHLHLLEIELQKATPHRNFKTGKRTKNSMSHHSIFQDFRCLLRTMKGIN